MRLANAPASSDTPQANKVMIQMHAVMSEWERDAISKRTKDALAAANARGVKLGVAGAANLAKVNDRRHAYAQQHALRLRSTLKGMRSQGLSQRDMVDQLNTLGLSAPRGGAWYLATLQRVLARLD
jgi:DNA invertase Pin-like site-specific DNA recombinase